jgi:hypothetical protein
MTQKTIKRGEIRFRALANAYRRSTMGRMDAFSIIDKIDLSYYELYRLLCFILTNDYIHNRYLKPQQM